MNAAELVVRMTADATDAVSGLDSVGAAARDMADDVDVATAGARDSASRLDSVASSADNMASSSSQAAGGLGDLGGALSLMPGPLGKLGAGMEAAAPAIMGVTGAADLANLALGSNIVQTTKARAATIANAVATRATAVATRTFTAAQWLMNAALTANPIGIVVLALAALAAAVVVAYKKSETFRNIVDTVMGAARDAVGWVVDKLRDLVDWIKDSADRWSLLKDKAVAAATWIKDKVKGAFDALTSPIQTIIDKVEWLLDKIGEIDFPDMPDLNPFGRTALGGTGGGGGGVTVDVDARTYITVDADALTDLDALAAKLRAVLDGRDARLGLTIQGAIA